MDCPVERQLWLYREEEAESLLPNLGTPPTTSSLVGVQALWLSLVAARLRFLYGNTSNHSLRSLPCVPLAMELLLCSLLLKG